MVSERGRKNKTKTIIKHETTVMVMMMKKNHNKRKKDAFQKTPSLVTYLPLFNC